MTLNAFLAGVQQGAAWPPQLAQARRATLTAGASPACRLRGSGYAEADGTRLVTLPGPRRHTLIAVQLICNPFRVRRAAPHLKRPTGFDSGYLGATHPQSAARCRQPTGPAPYTTVSVTLAAPSGWPHCFMVGASPPVSQRRTCQLSYPRPPSPSSIRIAPLNDQRAGWRWRSIGVPRDHTARPSRSSFARVEDLWGAT